MILVQAEVPPPFPAIAVAIIANKIVRLARPAKGVDSSESASDIETEAEYENCES